MAILCWQISRDAFGSGVNFVSEKVSADLFIVLLSMYQFIRHFIPNPCLMRTQWGRVGTSFRRTRSWISYIDWSVPRHARHARGTVHLRLTGTAAPKNVYYDDSKATGDCARDRTSVHTVPPQPSAPNAQVRSRAR
jgi:hypothetical protein